jgi:hypothetical protein
MGSDMGEETRRNFILAGSAQALLALEARAAFAQEPAQAPPAPAPAPAPARPKLVIRPKDQILMSLAGRLEFKLAANFTGAFQNLFIERVELSLATLAEGAESAMLDVIARTQAQLLKDFGDVPIPQDDQLIIIENTVLVQNVLFATGTDIGSGLVTLTTDAIRRAFDKYCADYPYCGRIKPKKK